MQHFSANFYKTNRRKLREQVDVDLIVFVANGQLQRNSDNPYPFRQDSTFWYMTGLDLSDVLIVIDLQKDEEWIILPEKSEYELLFDSQLEHDSVSKISGITTVLSYTEGWEQLKHRIKKCSTVGTITAPPDFIDVYAIYTNPTKARLCEWLRHEDVELVDLRPQVAALRVIKQSVEVVAIRQAIAITAETFMAVQSQINEYVNERDIEAELLAGYRRLGARQHGFTPIVAAGANAVTLHYHENESALKEKQCIVIDSGAEWCNYSADITRTYVYKGCTARQRAIYEAVYEAQQAGLQVMKPGNTFKDVDHAVCTSLEASIKALGLKALDGKSLLRSYYPHTSHYLGLDVHDVGDREAVLQPGMVWTLEPGLYIAAEGIGVRLEDDILITKDGYENLSQSLPSAPVDVLGK